MTQEANFIQNLLLDTLSLAPGRLSQEHLTPLSPAQWEALLRVANEQHVTPLLYARLREKVVETAVPDPIRQQLRHSYQINTVRNMSIYRELGKLVTALQEKDIPLIVLKGGFLADAVYGAMGERVIGDLDLLVPKEAMPQVIAVSEKSGYQKTKPVVLDIIMEQQHHIPPLINRTTQLVIEWHWHIVPPTAYHAIPVDGLWQRAKPAALTNLPVLTLSPEDLLLHIAEHLSYHHEFTFGMRSLCDLGVICAFYDGVIEWDVVVNRAKQWHWERGVYLTLRLAKERFGAKVPPFVLDRLRPDDFAEGLVETAVSQIFTDPTEFKFVPTAFRHIQGTQGIAGKARIIRDSLFPSPERMVVRYGIAPGSMPWFRLHLFRWQDLLRQAKRDLRRQSKRENTILPAVKRRNELSAWMALSE